MIRLVFLGKLVDLAGGDMREMSGPRNWPEMLAELPAPLAEALASDSIKVAVNGALEADKAAIVATAGDEIAFLPPVSGG